VSLLGKLKISFRKIFNFIVYVNTKIKKMRDNNRIYKKVFMLDITLGLSNKRKMKFQKFLKSTTNRLK